MLRFQTIRLSMWIIQKNAVSDEQQDMVQELQISFRSGEMVYLVLINKSMGFSQSLLRVATGADIIPKNQISANCRFIESIRNLPKLQIC